MGFSHHRNFPCYAVQLLLLALSCFLTVSAAIDTIRAKESLSDSEALISNGNRFKLSFFSPPNSSRRYLGIMYNLPVTRVVWVANRNKPINDSSATFQISSDGNLVILDGRKEIMWSTNVLSSAANSSAVLLDTGNLVLRDGSSNVSVWESFQHASDSWLEEMKIVTDLSRKEKNLLTSWKSPDDPAPRSFTFTIEPLDIPQSFIWKDGNPNWRTGPWNRQKYTGVPNMSSDYGYGVKVVSDSPGTVYQILNFTNSSVALYFLLNSSGSLEAKRWSDEKKGWDTTWPSTSNECERYGKCGPFGSCDAQHRPICSCFRGFRPRSEDEWDAGNWTSGCTRKTPLQCEQNNSVGKQDKFLKLEGVKLPNHFKYRLSEGGCRDKCLSSCSCIAYAVPPGIGCLHWTHNLTDNHKFTYGGDDLYIRLAHSELDNKQHHRTIIVTIAVLGFQFISFDILYKGKFPNGVEIAVKRLARSSNQGVDEFMNEVEVISRLQHRNLVRLLGCCVEIEEKLLVYEYMPNGSLDAYLFGSLRNKLLNWQRRKLIIEGICRGLLYLHRDSRLKIIHRDLKSSNILLDEVFKPKISDFGMARIFGGKDDQASTTRVVGTFGYMPPEYALREIFSEKSDVYSFGVLLLEIVSGKKNSSFYDQQLFLTAYAWKLWNEGKIVNLMDPTIHDSGLEDDTVRYANVGLLCVQEMAADRPNASTVLSMLSCEIVELPHPKQPAFLGMQSSQATESATKVSSKFSTSDMTISVVEGR